LFFQICLGTSASEAIPYTSFSSSENLSELRSFLAMRKDRDTVLIDVRNTEGPAGRTRVLNSRSQVSCAVPRANVRNTNIHRVDAPMAKVPYAWPPAGRNGSDTISKGRIVLRRVGFWVVFVMATIVREAEIASGATKAWEAVRDIGEVHRRLVPGLVTAVVLDSGVRRVTFANGLQLEELIVGVDQALMRVAYTAVNRARHHQASMQVIAQDETHCRFLWITDVLPDDIAERFSTVMDQAMPIIVRTLEGHARVSPVGIEIPGGPSPEG
jgi:hypothetical protein